MLFVDRSSVVAPPILIFGERCQVAKSAAIKHFSESLSKRRQVRFKFDAHIYSSPELRASLGHLFHSKCAYCESPIGSSPPVVDRFRPRTFSSDLEGAVSDDHYWWLAYEWENLFVACAVCARSKGRRFPVSAKRAPVGAQGDELRREGPMLLDPCFDDPNEHLSFERNGVVRGRTLRGRTTIDLLGLDRAELVAARGRAIDEMLGMFGRLKGGQESSWDQIVAVLQDPSQHYLGALRQVAGREFKKLSGIRNTDVSIDRAVKSVIRVAGTTIGDGTANLVAEVVASSLPSISLSKRLARENAALKPAYSLDQSDNVDKSYFRVNRLIAAVEIKDFRKIHHLRLEFARSATQTAPWSMLLGENGVGKSSILQAIGLTLIGKKYRQDLELNPEAFVRKGARRAEVKVWLTNLEKPIVLRIDLVKGFIGATEGMVLILGYGATRLMPRADMPDDANMPDDKKADYAKVDNLFNPFVPVGDAGRWLLQLTRTEFDNVARALKELLIVLDGPDQIVRRGNRIMVETGLGSIPLEQLSDGYQSVIGVTADIMKIMLRYWPAMEAAEGIVLIDELGAHLHPRWRMRVVSGLRRAFPWVQFVASTHDPLCLRGLEEGEVFVLRESETGETEIVSDVPPINRMRVEQLLTSELFGLHSTIDPDLDARFEEYLDLKSSKKPTPEKIQELEALRAELDRDMMLGTDRRERMMLEVIDQALAEEKAQTAEQREQSRALTRGSLAKIWREQVPESDSVDQEKWDDQGRTR